MSADTYLPRQPVIAKLTVALPVVAAAWTVAIGLGIWFGPIYGPRSFASISGFGPIPLIVPAALATLAATFAWRRQRAPYLLCTAAFGVFVIISSLSIGEYYIPAIGLLIWGLLALVAV